MDPLNIIYNTLSFAVRNNKRNLLSERQPIDEH